MQTQEWLTLKEVLKRWEMKRSTFYCRQKSGAVPAAKYPFGSMKPMYELSAIEALERDGASVLAYDKRKRNPFQQTIGADAAREMYALAALTGICAKDGAQTNSDVAVRKAWEIADQMMKTRGEFPQCPSAAPAATAR